MGIKWENIKVGVSPITNSIHFPHPTGTINTLKSETGGILPPFFLFAIYFRFLINFGYKHIFSIVSSYLPF